MTASILTVDDSSSLRIAIRIALSGAGYTVTEAGDGEEAAEGRMWIRDCSARVEDDELVIEAGVLLWTWVDRSSSAVGARFTVEQYVALEADVELRAIPQLTYRRDEHHALEILKILFCEVGILKEGHLRFVGSAPA